MLALASTQAKSALEQYDNKVFDAKACQKIYTKQLASYLSKQKKSLTKSLSIHLLGNKVSYVAAKTQLGDFLAQGGIIARAAQRAIEQIRAYHPLTNTLEGFDWDKRAACWLLSLTLAQEIIDLDSATTVNAAFSELLKHEKFDYQHSDLSHTYLQQAYNEVTAKIKAFHASVNKFKQSFTEQMDLYCEMRFQALPFITDLQRQSEEQNKIAKQIASCQREISELNQTIEALRRENLNLKIEDSGAQSIQAASEKFFSKRDLFFAMDDNGKVFACYGMEIAKFLALKNQHPGTGSLTLFNNYRQDVQERIGKAHLEREKKQTELKALKATPMNCMDETLSNQLKLIECSETDPVKREILTSLCRWHDKPSSFSYEAQVRLGDDLLALHPSDKAESLILAALAQTNRDLPLSVQLKLQEGQVILVDSSAPAINPYSSARLIRSAATVVTSAHDELSARGSANYFSIANLNDGKLWVSSPPAAEPDSGAHVDDTAL